MMWWKKKEVTVIPPLEGYNRWAATYSQESNPVKNLSDTFIEKFLPDLQGKTILDAGCGTGRFCVVAEKQHAVKVVGIDLSPAMIKIAQARSPLSEFRCGDLNDMLLEENVYDVVLCALALGHMEHLKPVLTKLVKALKAGGILIITDFHPFLTLMHSKRTFQDPITKEKFEIRHHLHLLQEYVTCLTENSATIEALEEPWFKDAPVIIGLCIKKR